MGQRHRDHANTGSVLKSDPNGALAKYFFGDGTTEKLPYQKFIKFHKDIHDEILWIEVCDFLDSSKKLTILLLCIFLYLYNSPLQTGHNTCISQLNALVF